MNAEWFREALAEAAREIAHRQVIKGRDLTVWEGFDILADVIRDKP